MELYSFGRCSHLPPIHSLCVDGGFGQFHGNNEVSFKRAIEKPPETFFPTWYSMCVESVVASIT